MIPSDNLLYFIKEEEFEIKKKVLIFEKKMR